MACFIWKIDSLCGSMYNMTCDRCSRYDCQAFIAFGNLPNSELSMALKLSNRIILFGNRYASSTLLRAENPAFQSAKRNASIHLSNPFVRKIKAEHITPLGWMLLVRTVSSPFPMVEVFTRFHRIDFDFRLFRFQRLVWAYGKFNVKNGRLPLSNNWITRRTNYQSIYLKSNLRTVYEVNNLIGRYVTANSNRNIFISVWTTWTIWSIVK